MKQYSLKVRALLLCCCYSVCFSLLTATQTWAVTRICEKCGQDYEQKYDPAAGDYRHVHVSNSCPDAPNSESVAPGDCFFSRSRPAGYPGLPPLNRCDTHGIEFPDDCPLCSQAAPSPPQAPFAEAGHGSSSHLLPIATAASQAPASYHHQALALSVFFLGQTLQNFIYSPQSQIDALHLLWNAASGATRRLLESFARRPDTGDAATETYRRLGYLFFSNRFQLTREWERSAHSSLPQGTNVQQVNFNYASSFHRMALNANQQIADSTGGVITRAIEPEQWSHNTVLAIYNIGYFAARWQETLHPSLGRFYLMGEDPIQVDTMTGEEISGGYYQSDSGWRAASLSYQGGEFEMVFILPPRGLLPGGANMELLNQLLSSLTPGHELNFSAPVTSLDSHFNLRDSLRHISLGNLLGCELDLSTMLSPPQPGTGPAVITSIEQKCFLRMDHTGTVAGAVTSMVCTDGPSRTVSFVVDRPFILVLRSTEGHAILFVGAVYDPSRFR